MQTIEIQFCKYDKFKNAVFICRSEDDEYKSLSDLNDSIETKYPDATSFLYLNEEHEYITLRIVKQTKFNFKEKNTYQIKYQPKLKTDENGRQYVNAIIIGSKLTIKFTPDFGEDIEL